MKRRPDVLYNPAYARRYSPPIRWSVPVDRIADGEGVKKPTPEPARRPWWEDLGLGVAIVGALVFVIAFVLDLVNR